MAQGSGITQVGSRFAQVAWVVPDIRAAETFFRETLGVSAFAKMENLSARELEGTYRGQPADFTFHLHIAYSNGALLELIQPVSGHSPFQEFLTEHPAGGVQHVAYTVPVADIEPAIAQLTSKGDPIVLSLRLPAGEHSLRVPHQIAGSDDLASQRERIRT
jgi:catechol 2,3-dioxygenase-like lactoylglutathione lyase family enzyme